MRGGARHGGAHPPAPVTERTAYAGGCHCGNLAVRFETAVPPAGVELRACQCSFCRAHGARTVSDPVGRVTLRARDRGLLSRYRFGQRTAEFWVCGRCGAYVAAVMADGDTAFATVNANVLELPEDFGRPPVARSYEGESAEGRRVRRRAAWTPAVIENEGG